MQATTRPSRRRTLFAAAGAVIMGGGITAGAAASVADFVRTNPDADLLALCGKAEDADRLMWAASDGMKKCPTKQGRDALRLESDYWFDRFVEHVDKAALIPARTVDGLRAKARVAYLNTNKTPEDDDLTSRLLREIGWGG